MTPELGGDVVIDKVFLDEAHEVLRYHRERSIIQGLVDGVHHVDRARYMADQFKRLMKTTPQEEKP